MNKIQISPYFIQIIADNKDADFLRLLSAIPSIEPQRKRDTYRCSLRKLPEVLSIMRGITRPEQVGGTIRELFEEELLRRSETAYLKENGPRKSSDDLWEHQQLGVELARVNRRYNFFYDTRTGKTKMSLRIMQERIRSGAAKRCLVLCPSAIIKSWLKDAEDFPDLKVVAYYKDEKQKLAALTTPAHVVIWSLGMLADTIELLKKIDWDVCFFDESSKVKSSSTLTAENVFDLSMTIPSWYNLSATPAPNGKHEYYTQIRTVDPCAFSMYITKFRAKYFDDMSNSKNYHKWQIKENMDAEFMSIVNDCSIYVDQSVMPTAGKSFIPVPYTMSAETQKLYKAMCSDMVAEIGGTTITAEQHVAMRAKLNQITSGFILDTDAIKYNKLMKKAGIAGDKQQIYRIDTYERQAVLVSLLKAIGNKKVIIWANYAAEFEDLSVLLRSKARYIRGGCSISDKEQFIHDFKYGSVQYLVCHPLSVGMGINLVEASNAIYYSLNDSWEAFKQSYERICGHISIQPEVCKFWIIQAVGTVNEIIYNNVKNKQESSTEFLQHLRSVAIQ